MNWLKKLNKIVDVIFWFILFCCIILALATFTGFNKFYENLLIFSESSAPADVIIVLGGGVVPDLKILPWQAQERVRTAVDLYQAGYADQIIVSGGEVKGQGYTESQFLREYAESLGVPPENIIEENRSTSTYENAAYSQQVMQEQGWQTALLVTSSYHSQRACRVFKKQGVSLACIAAPIDPAYARNYFRKLNEFFSVTREYGAVVYYWIKGYI